MSIKKDILWRVGLIYILVVSIGVLIIAKIIWLQFAEKDKWSENSNTAPVKKVEIEAVRGDIYSSDGLLLAVSVPYYDIRMDLTVDSLTNNIFYDNLDALSRELSRLFRDKSVLEYKRMLIGAREAGYKYYLVK